MEKFLPRRSILFIPSNPSPRSLIWPGIFTVAFTGGCFGLVSIARYHEHQGHKHRMIESAPARARDAWKTVERTNPSLLLLGPLIATNLGVYGCWKAFPDSTTMLKYFLQVPGHGRVLPLIFKQLLASWNRSPYRKYGGLIFLWHCSIQRGWSFPNGGNLLFWLSRCKLRQ